jgi:NAD(P)H dehydrogenase (quinone)
VPFTVLRNGWYTENYTGQIELYVGTGEVVGATRGGRVAAATRADYAAAAAAALLAEGTEDVVHELGGPAFTLDELAAAISEVTGTTVVHRDVPADELAARLQGAGLDAGTAGFFAAVDTAIAEGALDTDSDDLAQLLGRPATPLVDAVRAARTA